MWSRAASICAEECGELVREANNHDERKGSKKAMITEAIHTAATAIRFSKTSTKRIPSMSNTPANLSYGKRTVRMIVMNGIPKFSATDICNILGYVNPNKTLGRFLRFIAGIYPHEYNRRSAKCPHDRDG
jgi:hypothetical protein